MSSKKFERKEMIYIGVIVVLAVILAFSFLQNTIMAGSQKQVLDRVGEAYELLTEGDAEVLSVNDEGYVYRILLRLKLTGGDVLREVYATKDGRFFSESGNVLEVSNFMERLEKEKGFAECLRTKGFLVFGQSNEPNTVQQLLVIGNFANKIYVDCVGANLQACQQLGIEEIPTIVYGDKSYTGVKSLEWIETLTGCNF
jgi:hypothetical protein